MFPWASTFTGSASFLALLLSSKQTYIWFRRGQSSRTITTTKIMSAGMDANQISQMWDDRYGTEEFAYGTEPNDFLKESWPSLQLAPGSKCLLLAEGEGRNGVYLAELGMAVTGVDISPVGLEKAQKLAAQRNVTIQTEVADLATYEFGSEQWDAIVGISNHLPPMIRERVLQAIPLALKPGGYFLLEAYTVAQLEYKTGGPPDPSMMYSKEIFEQAFGGGGGDETTTLQIVRNEELVRDVVEGQYHKGKAAVVQFIGRKKLKVQEA